MRNDLLRKSKRVILRLKRVRSVMVLSDTNTTRMIVLVRVYNPQASTSIIARKQVRVTTNELNVTESAHCTTDVCRKRHYSIRERWTAQPDTSVCIYLGREPACCSATYLGRTFVLASSILTHFLSFCMRFCNFIALGCVKSKSAVNWLFIFWKTGSCTVACARRARLSDAAEENAPLTVLVTLSVDIQNGVRV